MQTEKGSLSINSENMFPIIKKWLYSDHDIFVRELISNGCDAVTKLKKLDVMGEFALPDGYRPRIEVICDPEEKTLQFTDNGIGMTADEVKEYINNIAFSGAEAFLEKYQGKANADQIIGHFGLGFYSAFMVSELVEIDTLSYREDAEAVHWSCDGSSEFTMDAGTRKQFGTTITLHLSEDCVEFSNYYRVSEVIKKYCSFMPFEIWLSEKDTKQTQVIKESERAPEDVVIEEIVKEKKDDAGAAADDAKPEEKELRIRRRPELQNDTHPLWAKTPSECTDEEYRAFYRKVFNDYKEPLFWIHLNMDYPFNLKGILYFPKINLGYDSLEGTIKLYNNQVFVADNIKEVIPEYMMLLKGVIDCPDLPLNVSRSALQNDGFVKKIQDYISRKLADKLSGLCKVDREFYEKNWDSVSPFVKYGCLRDEKFCKKMTDYILFKTIDGKYQVLPECLEVKPIDIEEEEEKTEESAENQEETAEAEAAESKEEAADQEAAPEEPKEKTVYYVTDPVQQSQYINLFKKAKMTAVLLPDEIDMPFIQQLEMKNEGIHFKRIDAEMEDALKAKNTKKLEEELKADTEKLSALFKKILKKDEVTVKVEKLKTKDISSMLLLSEETRRMQLMMKQYGMTDMGELGKGGETLILNTNHKLVQYLLTHEEGENVKTVCEELYDLARIQQGPLQPEAMTKFVARTNQLLQLLTE